MGGTSVRHLGKVLMFYNDDQVWGNTDPTQLRFTLNIQATKEYTFHMIGAGGRNTPTGVNAGSGGGGYCKKTVTLAQGSQVVIMVGQSKRDVQGLAAGVAGGDSVIIYEDADGNSVQVGAGGGKAAQGAPGSYTEVGGAGGAQIGNCDTFFAGGSGANWSFSVGGQFNDHAHSGSGGGAGGNSAGGNGSPAAGSAHHPGASGPGGGWIFGDGGEGGRGGCNSQVNTPGAGAGGKAGAGCCDTHCLAGAGGGVGYDGKTLKFGGGGYSKWYQSSPGMHGVVALEK